MDYELGKKLEMLEQQNAFLAGRIMEIQEELKKVHKILREAASQEETTQETGDIDAGEPAEPTAEPTTEPTTQPTEQPAKRGRGRPRKVPPV